MLAAAIAIALIIIFVIYPAALNLWGISQEITRQKKELENRQAKNYELKDIIASYKRYEPKLELLNRSVMSKNRELEFITTLEDIAARCNLQQKITIGDYQAMPGTAFNKMPLQVTLQGAYLDEAAYLQALEKLPPYVNIKQINLSAAPAGGQPADASISAGAGRIITMFIAADTFWQ